MAIAINGNGTITGLSAGGLPDSSIVNDDLAGSIADGKITGLSSSKLTGNLPAIDGSSLTGLPASGFSAGASAYATTPAQTIATGTWTQVTLGIEHWDIGGDFSSNTFTVGTGDDGKYLIIASVCFTGASVGDPYQISISIDGAITSRFYMDDAVDAAATSRMCIDIISLTATQTVGMYAYQASGGSKTISANSANTYLSIYQIA